MSGRKIAGCCVHVASTIYYLSFARYHDLRLPALNMNLVLIDTNKKQKPNDPKLVRVKRSINNRNNTTDELDTSSSDESENEVEESMTGDDFESKESSDDNSNDENEESRSETDENEEF